MKRRQFPEMWPTADPFANGVIHILIVLALIVVLA